MDVCDLIKEYRQGNSDRRYTGLAHRGALRRLTPLRPHRCTPPKIRLKASTLRQQKIDVNSANLGFHPMHI